MYRAVPTLKLCFCGSIFTYSEVGMHVPQDFKVMEVSRYGALMLRTPNDHDRIPRQNLPTWNLLMQLPIQQLKDLQQCPSAGMVMALQNPSKEVLEDYSANLDAAKGSKRSCVSIKSIMYHFVLKSFFDVVLYGSWRGISICRKLLWCLCRGIDFSFATVAEFSVSAKCCCYDTVEGWLVAAGSADSLSW